MGMDEKKYTLDDVPISANGLISAAAEIDGRFNADWFKNTATAATILRENGQKVETAPGYH